jgi:hypothetical protein
VYGFYIQALNYACILQHNTLDHSSYDSAYLDPETGCIDGYATPVLPETAGQYSGIFTKDEVEGGDTICTFIYEGDIVEPVLIDGTHQGFSWGRQVVVFERGAFCLKDRLGGFTPMCNYSANVKFRVWGNIHDNPELLEVNEFAND